MSRKRKAPKKIPIVDPKYKSTIIPKLINSIMFDGKKTVAEKIVYDAIDKIKTKSKDEPITIFNEAIKFKLISAEFRISFIHFPLIILSIVIGYFTKTTGFIWLAVLVVFAEFSIVVSRFIFYYEQAFMGDLVRFWYAALFLFASSYALIHEGHVRVDVLYTGFSESKKAWTNTIGSSILGIPLCLCIIFLGMSSKASIINSPLLSFEITQQGSSGLYLKYLMAAYLAIFAVSMLTQFTSYFMSNSYKILESSKQ